MKRILIETEHWVLAEYYYLYYRLTNKDTLEIFYGKLDELLDLLSSQTTI